ncbi:hypothetical protein CENSYa_0157 [Cenarchaeum symbiosum A]|uniref:Uncharacterized protein n=1 Tax=Cenarchaeum symbiosum (strain A) TaxID=414004 RepID=A0RTY5_CENSY|nr:hypothetical protein CENSYa_0157 [Cenarchaeum symbiosum A]
MSKNTWISVSAYRYEKLGLAQPPTCQEDCRLVTSACIQSWYKEPLKMNLGKLDRLYHHPICLSGGLPSRSILENDVLWHRGPSRVPAG